MNYSEIKEKLSSKPDPKTAKLFNEIKIQIAELGTNKKPSAALVVSISEFINRVNTIYALQMWRLLQANIPLLMSVHPYVSEVMVAHALRPECNWALDCSQTVREEILKEFGITQ